MSIFRGYRCSLCGEEYGSGEVTYVCPKDSANLDVVLDFTKIPERSLIPQNENSIWRYLSLLPVDEPEGKGTPLWQVGWTPTYYAEAIGAQLGLKGLWIKDESRNPTASFKDRASAIVVARAREIGAEVIVTASTGNAGAALAGMAAAVQHEAVIFAPKTAPPAKVAQLLIYGARVILVDGNYDSAFDLSIQASDQFGWYCRNTGYNPFTAEGKKTAAFEIWEAIHRGEIPHDPQRRLNVFVSVGDGNIISGLHKGFKDLIEIGWMEVSPRIYGVQADGSAAIANAFKSGSETIVAVDANTLADSISVDLPRDGLRALRAVTQTDGAYLTVSDDQILAAIAKLGQIGIFAEPAGATSFAGLVEAMNSGGIDPNDPVIVLNTGNGLKDVSAAQKAVSEAPIIEPSMEALIKIL